MIKFYFLIGIELLFSPFLYLLEEIRKMFGKYKSYPSLYKREPREYSNDVLFVIHEWTGYPYIRTKTIKYVNKVFTCGLKYHFDRLAQYNGKYKLVKILTISDCNEKYVAQLQKAEFYQQDVQIYPVPNTGMDFSGYNYACINLLDVHKEQIVFLTNTSVDSAIVPFIDSYIEVFRNNPEIGLLGISYSTKVYQSLIRNNFRPHLQSFFLVSRSGILKEVIDLNGGKLPGSQEEYKLSIIRFGEVKLTKMIEQLGYKIALVTEENQLYIFPERGLFYNGYSRWKLPMGDYRLHVYHPNKINILVNCPSE